MAKNYEMYALKPGKSVEGVAQAVHSHFISAENMESQFFKMEDGSYMVQGRTRKNVLRTVSGTERALNVKIRPVGESTVAIEMGSGKWVDKGIAGAISLFVLWPLACTALYGACKQSGLPKRIEKAVRAYLMI